MATPRIPPDEISVPVRSGPRRPVTPVPLAADGSPDLDGLRAHLVATLAERYPSAGLTDVGRAFDFAVEAQTGQRRASGEPYVTHPIASAQILADLGIDPVAIQAALELLDLLPGHGLEVGGHRGVPVMYGSPLRVRAQIM